MLKLNYNNNVVLDILYTNKLCIDFDFKYSFYFSSNHRRMSANSRGLKRDESCEHYVGYCYVVWQCSAVSSHLQLYSIITQGVTSCAHCEAL